MATQTVAIWRRGNLATCPSLAPVEQRVQHAAVFKAERVQENHSGVKGHNVDSFCLGSGPDQSASLVKLAMLWRSVYPRTTPNRFCWPAGGRAPVKMDVITSCQGTLLILMERARRINSDLLHGSVFQSREWTECFKWFPCPGITNTCKTKKE